MCCLHKLSRVQENKLDISHQEMSRSQERFHVCLLPFSLMSSRNTEKLTSSLAPHFIVSWSRKSWLP